MKIRVGCAMNLQGAKIEEEIEVSDEADEDEILEAVRDWALEQFEWWHEIIEKEGTP